MRAVFLLLACASFASQGRRIRLARSTDNNAGASYPLEALATYLFTASPRLANSNPSALLTRGNVARNTLRHSVPTSSMMEDANFGNLQRVYGLAGSLSSPVQGLLDKYAHVRLDATTEKEYWVLGGGFELLRKDESLTEVAIGGLAAGAIVELAVAFSCYPFDTVKTRLQADPNKTLGEPPTLDRLYDGFGPVALSVPALSVFWATRDVVRTSIFRSVKNLPFPVLDVYATGLGAILGEALHWFIITPTEVLKTQRQASVLEEEGKEMHASFVNAITINEILKAWPVLALADVPYVGLRVMLFVALHDSGLFRSGVTEDALIFLFANMLAITLTTPLDVVRTQMLLRGSAIGDMPTVVGDIYKDDGPLGFTAGWTPRLLYNGLLVGLVWGFVRQGYDGLRASFLVEFLDRFESLCAYLSTGFHWPAG